VDRQSVGIRHFRAIIVHPTLDLAEKNMPVSGARPSLPTFSRK
jgi:hypothetical protein